MAQSKAIPTRKLGPDRIIESHEDLIEMSLDAINLQREIIVRATCDQTASDGLKRLKGLIDTHKTLMTSPRARGLSRASEEPSLVDKLVDKLLKINAEGDDLD